MTVGTWYLMANPNMQSKLREELVQAIPEPHSSELVGISCLENLPYLRAVVKESLRLSYGAPGRVPRIVPEGGAELCGQQIPGGVSASINR